jgi:hypothetical protein
MTRRTTIALAIVGAVVACYGGVRWYKGSHYHVWLATVSKGGTKQAVIPKMGTTVVVEPPPRSSPTSRDATVSMYGHLLPAELRVVGFNGDERAAWVEGVQLP